VELYRETSSSGGPGDRTRAEYRAGGIIFQSDADGNNVLASIETRGGVGVGGGAVWGWTAED